MCRLSLSQKQQLCQTSAGHGNVKTSNRKLPFDACIFDYLNRRYISYQWTGRFCYFWTEQAVSSIYAKLMVLYKRLQRLALIIMHYLPHSGIRLLNLNYSAMYSNVAVCIIYYVFKDFLFFDGLISTPKINVKVSLYTCQSLQL